MRRDLRVALGGASDPPERGCALDGLSLDRGGLLVHRLDLLRQSRHYHRPFAVEHVRRHRTGPRAAVRCGAAPRGAAGASSSAPAARAANGCRELRRLENPPCPARTFTRRRSVALAARAKNKANKIQSVRITGGWPVASPGDPWYKARLLFLSSILG